ncbi:MAG: serine hydroxymethyltransferase [Phycisphaerae bacterium]|nr:serine hydroxymethyltransferase [Phycisphaerae bacterium]
MTHPADDAVYDLIHETDPDAAAILEREKQRQESTIELIASENHASAAVTHAMGTCFTNKYAEGYPGRRYYGGCAHMDEIEELARARACELFGCKFANVQPHSGAQANTAAFIAMMSPGDTFASLVLADGGHLSHGMKINFSGMFYNPVHYPLHYDKSHPEHERIDYDAVREVCLEHKPRLLLTGYSAYSRQIDFEKFRAIADECGAVLMADIAHIAGLVAAGEHPSPFPHCDIVTTTTHKSLRGPRGGLVLMNDEEIYKKVNKALFPGVQGGPLMHVVFSKAVAFGEALRPDFKVYQQRVRENAVALAEALVSHGYRICSGGTDNHVMLVDLSARDENLTGADAEKWLEAAGIICNKNGIPQDPRPPMKTSGIRLGTPATTTRGFGPEEMKRIAGWIDEVLGAGLQGDAALNDRATATRAEVATLCEQFPMPGATARV